MKTTIMSISLPKTLREFVEDQAREHYGSSSEYIRELIRLDIRRLLDQQQSRHERRPVFRLGRSE